ncbi:rhomboid family intramembrane serine protease [Planctomycetales bacterium]|nr:rhomboid family intramembrane serine protease [Planctomycetales bacterium]GHT34852.1 rhomboid family intramembrane serine protease [Planctomycetales bacterium]
MGFSDRDYNHWEQTDHYHRKSGSGTMSVTARLIILNFVLWLVNGFFCSGTNALTGILALECSPDDASLVNPLHWWQFLTYGFVHSPSDFYHILFNMLNLLMFGYGLMLGVGPGGFRLFRGGNVEERLGRMEFLFFYLLTIIIGGIVFSIVNFGETVSAIGASGGVTGVVILFALFFPNRTLMLMGLIPMPMWLIGVLIVCMDAFGAAGLTCGGIAYVIHLSGAAFAVFYYYVFYQNNRRLTDGFGIFGSLFRRNPKIKIHKEPPSRRMNFGTSERETDSEEQFKRRLDAILGRYGQVGESGLTADERQFLQTASKKYREKHRSV